MSAVEIIGSVLAGWCFLSLIANERKRRVEELREEIARQPAAPVATEGTPPPPAAAAPAKKATPDKAAAPAPVKKAAPPPAKKTEPAKPAKPGVQAVKQ
ncbi:MAG TPA: hypothetical protein VMD30_08805 [Tepidisphaeraceae bacterium]|nr:hypothetical protein [Tepidisphaeraceae bacterium]